MMEAGKAETGLELELESELEEDWTPCAATRSWGRGGWAVSGWLGRGPDGARQDHQCRASAMHSFP